jgi:hypothetical protein
MNPPGAPAATVRETHEPNLPDAAVAPRRRGVTGAEAAPPSSGASK